MYAALMYYHDHKNQLDAQIARGVGEADAARAAATDQPTRAGLGARAAGHSSGDAGGVSDGNVSGRGRSPPFH